MCTFRFKVEMMYVCACVTISDARALAFENMGTKSARHWNPGFQSLGRPEDVSLSSDPLSVYPVSWSGPTCYFLFRSSRISDRPSLSADLAIHFRMKYSGFFFWPRKVNFLGELFLEHTLDRCRRRVLFFPPCDSYDVNNNFCDWKIAFEAEKLLVNQQEGKGKTFP